MFSVILQLGLTAAQIGDVSLAEGFGLHALASVLAGTHFGAVWQVRLALLVGLFVAGVVGIPLFHQERRGPSRFVDAAVLLLAVFLLASLVATGHAQATDRRAWLLATDMIHAGAAGAWPGGLLPLVILLARPIGIRSGWALPSRSPGGFRV